VREEPLAPGDVSSVPETEGHFVPAERDPRTSFADQRQHAKPLGGFRQVDNGVIIGVDIGVTGVLALLTPDGSLVDVFDMPSLDDGLAGRRSINAAQLAEIVAKSQATQAFVETVDPRPGEGAVAAFAFGRARGVVEGVLAALDVSITFLTPPAWKRIVGIAPGLDGAKDAARSLPIQRWPGQGRFALKKNDGRAEAALIALAGIKRGEQ